MDIKKTLESIKTKSIEDQLNFIGNAYSPDSQIFIKTFYNTNGKPYPINLRSTELNSRQEIQIETIKKINSGLNYLKSKASELKIRMKLIDQKLNFNKRKIMSLFKGDNVKNRVVDNTYWVVGDSSDCLGVLQDLKDVAVRLLEDIRKYKN